MRLTRLHRHSEHHLVGRIGWMRAAVLGANDGIISTASLIVGVAAAATKQSDVLIAGVAGLVAGAIRWRPASMYLSVRNRTQSRPISPAKARSWATPLSLSSMSWPKYT